MKNRIETKATKPQNGKAFAVEWLKHPNLGAWSSVLLITTWREEDGEWQGLDKTMVGGRRRAHSAH